MKLFDKLATYKKLGVNNLLHVAFYRIALKLGYFKAKLPVYKVFSDGITTPFFSHDPISHVNTTISSVRIKAFGWLDIEADTPPNWHKAVNSNEIIKNNQVHWCELNDFDQNVGDIKTVWELSRFDWLFSFTLSAINQSDEQAINKINHWLSDWCQHNPINQGVNWKCGQEASIRLLHLISTSYLLGQHKKLSNELATLVYLHLTRIMPTVHYAMAQDNNHGTSEAAAIYLGCGLLLENDHTLAHLSTKSELSMRKKLQKWQRTGKYWLENRAKKLIASDGTFSQNSVNYHRLMLDCFSLVEFFRIEFVSPPFTNYYYNQLQRACRWLYKFTDKNTGHAPNMGPNDGANLLPLTACDYRDYRPSVQWAYQQFLGYTPYEKTHDHHQLTRLFSHEKSLINETKRNNIPHQDVHPENSFQLLHAGKARVYLRTPNSKFRPSSCDALHVDLWCGSTNLLRDAGSYSYNCEPKWQAYFLSTQAHNTIEFDQHQQMPKISRFLYGDWIKTKVISESDNQITANYQDYRKCQHQRTITLQTQSLEVIDNIANFEKSATLRWRLSPSNWQLSGNTLTADKAKITINADVKITQISLVEGYESRYYLQKNNIPILEVTVENAGKIISTIAWSL